MTPVDDVTVERFWARVDRAGGADACWPWVGSVNGSGYGMVSIAGRQRIASRTALMLAANRWDLDSSVLVLHRCDNPPCCNPAHLYFGSNSDNKRDQMARGLHRRHGELSPKDGASRAAIALDRFVRRGYGEQSRLASALGVHPSYLGSWRKGVDRPGEAFRTQIERLTGGRVRAADWFVGAGKTRRASAAELPRLKRRRSDVIDHVIAARSGSASAIARLGGDAVLLGMLDAALANPRREGALNAQQTAPEGR